LKYILFGLLFAYLFGVCAVVSYALINSLIPIHQEEAFVALLFLAIITLVLFTTVVSCMNVLYFSDDNRFILPLPLKPLEVLSAKLNTLLVYVYMEEAMVGFAPMIMYGILTKQGLIYYPIMLLVLIFLPIVPLLIVAFIVMSVMACTKGIRNKNLVQMITMIVSIIFSLCVSALSSSTSGEEDALVLVNKAQGLVEIYKKAFITMPLAIDAVTKNNVLSLLLLIGVSVILYVLVCAFSQKIYYRGMLGSLYSSSGVSNKKIDEKTAYRSKGLGYSYVMKELKVYLRRPTFFVQLVLPCLILPAFMMVVFYFSTSSKIPGGLSNQLELIYEDKDFQAIIYAVALMIIMFITMYSFMSTVAVSKDGHDAYAMKYLPIPFSDQLIYKMIPDVALCLFSYISVIVVAMILFKLPLMYFVMSLPVSILYCILHGFLILTDVRKPKLDWTNEMQIIKRNTRTMFTLAFTLINMGLVAILAFLFKMKMSVLAIALSVIYLIAVIVLYRYIRTKDIRLADGFE
jgi:ABC-2 type transport system permease protein